MDKSIAVMDCDLGYQFKKAKPFMPGGFNSMTHQCLLVAQRTRKESNAIFLFIADDIESVWGPNSVTAPPTRVRTDALSKLT